MSQRQLAARSGLSHATVSRLLHEDREPSLDTAIRLAGVLLGVEIGSDAAHHLGLLSEIGAHDPVERFGHALRADRSLDEISVRRILDYYHAVRGTFARSRDR